MKRNFNKQAGIALLILALSGATISGCLQSKAGNTQSTSKVEAQYKEIDPVQWYETVRWQSMEAVRELLAKGADPDQTFFSGETALHLAVEQGNSRLVELLLAYGADVNVQERRDGFTPLMYAAIKDDQKMMRFLVSHGADPTAPDIDGYTTYHYLAARGNKTATQLLAGNAPVPDLLPTRDGLTVSDVVFLSKKTMQIIVASNEHH